MELFGKQNNLCRSPRPEARILMINSTFVFYLPSDSVELPEKKSVKRESQKLKNLIKRQPSIEKKEDCLVFLSLCVKD